MSSQHSKNCWSCWRWKSIKVSSQTKVVLYQRVKLYMAYGIKDMINWNRLGFAFTAVSTDTASILFGWKLALPTTTQTSRRAWYFLDAIRSVGSVPRILRADNGAENVHVNAAFQRFFRRKSIDVFAGEKSFMCRKSVSNQRIEAWWDQLRREGMDWWDFFEERQLMHLPGKRVLCMEDQSQYCLRGSQKL